MNTIPIFNILSAMYIAYFLLYSFPVNTGHRTGKAERLLGFEWTDLMERQREVECVVFLGSIIVVAIVCFLHPLAKNASPLIVAIYIACYDYYVTASMLKASEPYSWKRSPLWDSLRTVPSVFRRQVMHARAMSKTPHEPTLACSELWATPPNMLARLVYALKVHFLRVPTASILCLVNSTGPEPYYMVDSILYCHNNPMYSGMSLTTEIRLFGAATTMEEHGVVPHAEPDKDYVVLAASYSIPALVALADGYARVAVKENTMTDQQARHAMSVLCEQVRTETKYNLDRYEPDSNI